MVELGMVRCSVSRGAALRLIGSMGSIGLIEVAQYQVVRDKIPEIYQTCDGVLHMLHCVEWHMLQKCVQLSDGTRTNWVVEIGWNYKHTCSWLHNYDQLCAGGVYPGTRPTMKVSLFQIFAVHFRHKLCGGLQNAPPCELHLKSRDAPSFGLEWYWQRWQRDTKGSKIFDPIGSLWSLVVWNAPVKPRPFHRF